LEKVMKKFIYGVVIALCIAVPAWGQPSRPTPDLAHAIAYAEGFYVKGSKSNRNHNPGNIRRGTAYVRYRSDREGRAALYELLKRVTDNSSRFYSVNMNLREFGNVYADGHGIWAKNVAKLLKVQVTAKLWEILDVAPQVKTPVTLKGLTLPQ
jgi:hypothetical protein